MSVFKRLPPSLLIAVFTLCNLIGNAQQPRLVLPVGHTSQVNTAVFSSDEKYMVSAGLEKFVYVWDVPTGKLLWALAGHKSPGILATFSKDGKYIISMGSNLEKENCIVWNFLSGLPIAKFHVDDFETILSLENNLLFLNDADSTRIYDILKKRFVFNKAKSANHKLSLDDKGNFIQIVATESGYFLEKYSLANRLLINKVALKISDVNPNKNTEKTAGTNSRKKPPKPDGFASANANGNDDSKLSFLISSTGKYIAYYKKGPSRWGSGNPLDTLFLLDGITGKLIYQTNYDFIPNSIQRKDGSVLLFTKDEKHLIWRAESNGTYKQDEANILNLENLSLKQYYLEGLNENVLLENNYLYTYYTSSVTSREWNGTKEMSYIYKLNILTGERLILRIHGTIKSFQLNQNYLFCGTESSKIGYDYNGLNNFSTFVINKSNLSLVTNLENTHPPQVTSASNFSKTKFLLINLINKGVQIYDGKTLALKSTAKLSAKEPGVINFVHQDSLLFTGNRFYNYKNLQTQKILEGLFIDYSVEENLVKLFTSKDTTISIYDLKSMKSIKAIKGFPLRNTRDSTLFERGIWDYVITPKKDGFKYSSVLGNIEFETNGKVELVDDSTNYMIVTLGYVKPKSVISFRLKKDVEGDTILPKTSIWNLKSGELIKSLNFGVEEYQQLNGTLTYVALSPNTDSAQTILFDVKKNLTRIFEGDFKQFSEDKKKLYTIDSLDKFHCYDLESGNHLAVFANLEHLKDKTSSNDTNWVALSKDYQFKIEEKKFILSNNYYSSSTLSDLSNNILLDLSYKSLFKLNEKEKIIVNHEGGATTFYHLPSVKPYLTYIELDSINYLSKLNNGYYMATPGASKQVYYVNKDLKIVTFEQLDVKYNRPDKVLQEIGSTDTALIQSYKKAYEKRIKKLGIDTTSFKSGYSVPEADFKNRDLIGTEQKKQRLALHITGKDNTYTLDRFNVWVNENPVFGMRGINIRKRNKKMIDTTIYITLSDGPNQIETSITNINGTESYRMPLNVNYTPEKKAVEKLYFVGIGIDQFKQSQNNLQWSVKDVRDQAKALKLKYGNNISIDTLFNQDVTVNNIRALKQKLKLSGVNDKVIIAYSGHGMLSSDYDYFLSTYNVNFNKPQQNGLPYDDLEDLLDNIPARKKLMLIDACHSGEVDKEELLKYKNAENVLASNKTSGARGVKVMNTGPKKAGMKTSMELMQQLFVNVGRSTGATVISAAAGTQFALEKSDLKNGVFSYSILEYMQNNPHATVSELKKYVNKRVVELTAGLQVPTTRNETNTVNWQVW